MRSAAHLDDPTNGIILALLAVFSVRQHKGKNKWIVTYETLHPSSGWISGKNEINPSISGFTTIGSTIDITWQ